MICIVIKGPTFEEAYEQIRQAIAYSDLVELRLDYFNSLDLEALKILRNEFTIPMIFTLRSQAQGGNYTQTEGNRLADILLLLALKPEYFDLENDILPQFFEELSKYPEVRLILSYHNFKETPDNLEMIYQEMQKIPAFLYKIAVTANNCIDALKLICWARKPHTRLIAISMGGHGQISRILAPLMKCAITYASLKDDQISAPGQLSAKTLIERYHHKRLNPNTLLYGLIGDPVDLSISDKTHNALFASFDLDAVYIKIQVRPEELHDFLQFAKKMPFQGLSVTMPLKEHVLAFLDDINPQAIDIGAVNTLYFKANKVLGFNTDGFGALNAIEKLCLVNEKRIVIIGAGGAAKAIAYEACQRGAIVTIANRDAEKALQLAKSLNCVGVGIEDMQNCYEAGYDILINCTSVPLPISPDYILPHAIIMDIVTKPRETEFLKQALRKECRVIYGYHMFIEQALGQFNLWFENRYINVEGKRMMENEVIRALS